MAKSAKKPTAAAALRDPTDAERVAIEAAKSRLGARTEPPKIFGKVDAAGVLRLDQPHSDGVGWNAHLSDALGSRSEEFSNRLLAGMEQVCRPNGAAEITTGPMNYALAIMTAVAPANELEAVIGAQIVAASALSLDLAGRAKQATTVETMAAYVGMQTKVSRTMAAHVDTLARLRTGGKQTHEVRYVYINNGVFGDNAQALFGGVEGGGGRGNGHQSQAPGDIPGLTFAPGVPVRSAYESRDAVQGTGGPWPEKMPDARGFCGRADRLAQRPVPDRDQDTGGHRGSEAGERDGQVREGEAR